LTHTVGLADAVPFQKHTMSTRSRREMPQQPSLQPLTSKMVAISVMNGQQAAAAVAVARSGVDDVANLLRVLSGVFRRNYYVLVICLTKHCIAKHSKQLLSCGL